MATRLTFFCWERTWVSGRFGWPCPRLQPQRFQIHYNSRQPCLGQHRVCICPVQVLHCISRSAPLYLSRPSIVFLSRLFPPPQASSFHSVQWCRQFAPCGLSSAICPLWNVIRQYWKIFVLFLCTIQGFTSVPMCIFRSSEYDEAFSHSLHLWDLYNTLCVRWAIGEPPSSAC